MTKKFETAEELHEFIANASPEEIQALNKELTTKFIKKILLGVAIGGAVVLSVLAISKAIEKNNENDAILTDGSDTPDV